MKSERFTLFILLVEIVAIGYLHTAKSGKPQPAATQSTQAASAQKTDGHAQWNKNFTLIRLK